MTQQELAKAELSQHLHHSISAMTPEELRAFTDALATAFLGVDEIAKLSRIAATKPHPSQMNLFVLEVQR